MKETNREWPDSEDGQPAFQMLVEVPVASLGSAECIGRLMESVCTIASEYEGTGVAMRNSAWEETMAGPVNQR